jgi:hypothetical protein
VSSGLSGGEIVGIVMAVAAVAGFSAFAIFKTGIARPVPELAQDIDIAPQSRPESISINSADDIDNAPATVTATAEPTAGLSEALL